MSERGKSPGAFRARYTYLRTDGTAYIVAGSAVAGLAGYAYQVMGGRALGPERFAPVSALLTIHFLTFIVVMMPIEQVIVRRLTLGREPLPRSAVWLGAVTVGLATMFAAIGVNNYLNGDVRFVAFTAIAVAAHFLFAVGRGFLAGRRRFRAYGLASGWASIGRLVIAIPLAIVGPYASGFALALIAGAFVVLLWQPFQIGASPTSTLSIEEMESVSDRGLLAGLVLAAASSQALLLAAPIVVGMVGGSGVEVSTAFAAFTLARAPLVFGYNLLARVLPPFTEMAAKNQTSELTAWARGIALTSLGMSAVAFALGWLAGPETVRLAFGEGYEMTRMSTALIAAGVIFSGSGMFVGQILVARGDSVRLAAAWILGLVSAIVVLLFTPDVGSLARVVSSFLVGEAVAMVTLVFGAVVSGDRRSGLWLRSYSLAKRTLDLGVSMFILILSLPILAAAGLLIRLDSPGPIFFSQVRIGRDGRPFEMIKLRTMKAEGDEEVFAEHLSRLEAARHEETAPTIRIDDDSRITAVGAVLRKWSIDELPNLWNVIRGEMSLVGPRPLVPPEALIVSLDSPRFRVPPGITGWAQINGRDEITILERAELDDEYVARRSLGLDLRILVRTVRAVFAYRSSG